MSYTQDNIEELKVLMLFDLTTSQEGIKVHKTAEAGKISATQRLYDKGFITQVDGGYLTSLGREAAEHTHFLYTMLNVN